MALKRILLSALAAALVPGLTGCQCIWSDYVSANSRAYQEHCASGFELRLQDAPCRKPFGYGSNHCGLHGVACTLTNETCALAHVLASYHWEGDYPHGACGPWVGHWAGCCGAGGIPDPCGDCDEVIAVPIEAIPRSGDYAVPAQKNAAPTEAPVGSPAPEFAE